jgi:hypothetical protein
MIRFARWSILFACIVLVPAVAHAQATLSGIVRDPSGAILPGVTVEATSPVLIEKVRTATTDGNGRYQIIDLRPGEYTVTFTLSGFSTVRSERVQLTGTATTTLNAALQVGALSETITVSGESPTVDVQSTTRQVVIDQETIAAIPSSRTPFAVGVLIAGVTQSFGGRDVGGAVVAEVAALAANGGRTGDQRMMVNGVALSSGIAGGWGGGAVPNATGTAEYAIDVSAVDAQAATGGVRVNFIPRDGGNRFSGTFSGTFARESFVSDNYAGTDVERRGLAAPGTIVSNGEVNPGVGGPIVRDKLWFFVSAQYLYADNLVAGQFFNENANRPDAFTYVRSNRQALLHQDKNLWQGRFTYQVNQKNKLGVTYDQEAYCGCPFGVTATVTPDGASDRRFPLQRFVTADWTLPLTSKVLIEASGIHRVERWGGMHLQTGKGENLDAILPGITSVTDNPNPVTGGSLTYRSAAQFNNSWNWNIHYRAALSYVTGSHQFKVGFNNAFLHHENTTYTDPTTPYSYNFASGAPTQIVYRIAPRTIAVDVTHDFGLFAQDRWTVGRWTLMGGIRFDSFANKFPEAALAGTFFGRTINVPFEEAENLRWKDITPKLGATYDLFGTGKTALKVSLNKYLEGLGTTGIGAHNVSESPHPINRISGINVNSNRTWNDTFFGPGDPRSGNFRPDCDLNNFDANGECGGLSSASTFGALVGGTTFDPDLLTGWGKRAYNWEFTAGVQHELMPRVSLTAQFARRWYGNFRVTDDLAVTAADYQRFTFVAPTDSRLPDGGGQTFTGFDVAPTAGPARYFVTRAKNFGDQSEVFTGFSIGVNARLMNGLNLQGGVGPGRVVTDDCDIVDDLPEMLHTLAGNPNRSFVFATRPLERCHENNGWRTGVQGLASYLIPRIDVNVSATFQNQPGAQLAANANTCAGAIAGTCTAGNTTLGRAFTAAPFRAINIVDAGEVYVERLNQIDLRLSKVFRVSGTRTMLNFDFYNVTNSNSVLTENATFGAPWRTPQSILLPRLFKLGMQFDF